MPTEVDTSGQVSSTHSLVRNNHDEISSWLSDVLQAFAGWPISKGAAAFLEREGRVLSEHDKNAVGFVAAMLLDIVVHIQKYKRPEDGFDRAMDNAASAFRVHHLAQAGSLSPMVATQLDIALQHIKRSSDAR